MKSCILYLKAGTALSIIILLLVTLPVSTALASIFGPNDAKSGTSVSGIGTQAWQNPGNITKPGTPFTTVTLYQSSQYSNYLQGTGFGFAIPTDAHIDGISVTINRMSSAHNPSIIDNVVRLVKDGSIVGDNKASTSTEWPLSFMTATYGGSTDLWGTIWNPEDINSENFGVVMAAYRQNNGNNQRTASVDYISIIVYYSMFNTSTTFDCGNGSPVVAYGDNLTCVATVTRLNGGTTPNGTVGWTTDGNSFFKPNSCTLSGADGVSTCSVTYTPSAVGTGSHLITATYIGDEYFTTSSTTQTVIVTTRPLSITADAQSKVFGNDDPAFTYYVTSGSLVFSDTFTGTLTRKPGEEVGSYAIMQGSLALSVNYDLTYEGNYLTITKANPSCAVIPYDVTYDGSRHSATGTCIGVNDELLNGLDLSGTTHADVGIYPEVPWKFTDETGNYNDADGTVNDEITTRAITIVADSKTKLYRQPDPDLTYKITSGSLAFSDAFSGVLIRDAGESVGTYAIQQGTLILNANYTLTYVGANLTITNQFIYLPIILK